MSSEYCKCDGCREWRDCRPYVDVGRVFALCSACESLRDSGKLVPLPLWLGPDAPTPVLLPERVMRYE